MLHVLRQPTTQVYQKPRAFQPQRSVTASKKDNKFAQVVQKIDPHSKLLRTWELKGGISAQVTALEIEQPDGHTKKMIVRQHGEVDLKHNPHVAADEFKLLQLLHSVGLATPTPYHLDQSGEIFSTPYIILEYIEGKPSGLYLSAIHQCCCMEIFGQAISYGRMGSLWLSSTGRTQR